MKRFLISMLLALPGILSAQVKLYDELCDPLQAVFCDYARNEGEVMYLSNANGQYIGTLIDKNLYGWGFFLSNDGSQSFGQYRNGKIVFGLIITDDVAKVGSDENYVMYSLKSGEVIAWYANGGRMPLEYPLVATAEEPQAAYSFKKERYANGDMFYGEFFEGRRHGYGVYCWANGDMWYGRYKEGYRNGYGMLITPDRMVHYGKWVGDRKVE